jgi:hypothetical protein
MSCEEMQERLGEQLTGELDGERLAELRTHLATCAGCAEEKAAFERLWQELGETPEEEPGPEVRRRFDSMLASAVAEERASTARRVVSFARGGVRRGGFTPGGALSRFAAIAATLLVGVFLGSEYSRRRDASAMAELRGEVRELHESVALALRAERSPSERLRGVSYGRELAERDERVAEALFQALLSDPNVNVRLAALDALRPRLARPEERPRVVAAVIVQDSPLVQLTLLTLLLESDGVAARKDIEQLLANPDLDPAVRGFLRDRLGRSV